MKNNNKECSYECEDDCELEKHFCKCPRHIKNFPKEKFKPKSIVANMPAHLKDPANYRKICKALLEVGATKHSHSEIGKWKNCKVCQNAYANVQLMKIKLGFESGAQYMAWKRIHTKIEGFQKVKLPKYNT